MSIVTELIQNMPKRSIIGYVVVVLCSTMLGIVLSFFEIFTAGYAFLAEFLLIGEANRFTLFICDVGTYFITLSIFFVLSLGKYFYYASYVFIGIFAFFKGFCFYFLFLLYGLVGIMLFLLFYLPKLAAETFIFWLCVRNALIYGDCGFNCAGLFNKLITCYKLTFPALLLVAALFDLVVITLLYALILI